MKAYVHAGDFTWDLDASVGKHGQNSNPADVSYIQWYYTLAAEHPLTPPERKQVYQQVKVTGSCSGRDDDPLVQAILIHQRTLKHPVIDGRIDPAPGHAGNIKIGDNLAHFVFRLSARLADMFPQFWPRLDAIPRCPDVVAKAVNDAIPKVPKAS